MGGIPDSEIVRVFWLPDAATGDGRRYQTADGTVWKEARYGFTGATGEVRGAVVGNRVVFAHGTRQP